MTKRKAVIHIGVPKTGSTTIQRTLSASRSALADEGFHYSSIAGHSNHLSLAHYVLHHTKPTAGRVRIPQWVSGSTMTSPAAFERLLDAEIAALPSSIHTLVFSSEHLAGARMAEGVSKLKALLTATATGTVSSATCGARTSRW